MLVKYVIDEDFINYKLPSMFIGCHSCTFKCGYDICQNHELAEQPDIEIGIGNLINRYCSNPITSAIVFGGLEPFDDIDNIIDFIHRLRNKKFIKNGIMSEFTGCNDDIVIYTGYTEEEIKSKFDEQYRILKLAGSIIIKYGRFIPNCKPHYDEVLGVNLYSDNQYAKRI